MLKYYLKIVSRNIVRTKEFFIINILGLSIGIACAFVVYLYADFELSYDKNIKDHKQIYRIITDDYQFGTSEPTHKAKCSLGLIPVIKNNYPQIEGLCYFTKLNDGSMSLHNELISSYNGVKADPNFFQLFAADFVYGNSNAIGEPNTCVVTKKIAERYFKNKNPLGEIFIYNDINYEIKGVINDWPINTHINFDFILSFEPHEYDLTMWAAFAYVYVKFKPKTDVRVFNNEIRDIYKSEMGAKFNPEYNKVFFIQALSDIHFNSSLSADVTVSGNSNRLYLYSFVGILILLIACINYMNLTTAKHVSRAKDIGIRKTIGANKSILFFQFLFESLIFTFIAHVIAIFLVEITLPYLNTLLQMSLKIDYLNMRVGMCIISLILVTTLISGTYPAFLLSSSKPDRILKRVVHIGSGSGTIRRMLVIFQFVISIILVITVLVIYKQMLFMKDYELGFDRDHKLIIQFPKNLINNDIQSGVKSQFMQIPNVKFCSFSSIIPGRPSQDVYMFFPGEGNTRAFPAIECLIDEDFCTTLKLVIVAGRDFHPDDRFISKGQYDCIINETAVKTLGFESPEESIGKRIFNNRSRIIGVVKDYHHEGLHEKIENLFFNFNNCCFEYLILDIGNSDHKQSIIATEKVFDNLFPNTQFEYFFLDQEFDKQYRSEELMAEIFTGLSGLGIFIGCLGLLGLTSFMAQCRTKEIGVRKVHGASILGIVMLLSKEFSKWVLLANIIAWPLAYYFLSRWLEKYAYHINISIWPFIMAGLITLVIANLTTIFQALKAAKANPVDALKCE
ncbi:MAG: ABC transporter permease [Bacteroidetes bacterium]|nr:ABC transporter permease [Bacteroidota bacterium]